MTVLHREGAFRARLCGSCQHFEVVEDDEGLSFFCGLAREPLDDIRVAASCPGYAPEGQP